MAGFFYEMEKVIRENSDNALEMALHYYGQELLLHRPSNKNDPFAQVHGKNAGVDVSFLRKFEGILQSDDFSTSDGSYSYNFEEGFLLTKDKGILVGDEIKIATTTGGVRVFKVDSREDIGYSTDMFVRWKISNKN